MADASPRHDPRDETWKQTSYEHPRARVSNEGKK